MSYEQPLTREEVQAWAPLGPNSLTRGGSVTIPSAPEDAEDPHSPAFYRVGQTGVERALPVADVPRCDNCGKELVRGPIGGWLECCRTPAVCGTEFSPFGIRASSFIKSAKCTLPTGHLGHHKWTASLNPTGPPTVLDVPPAAKPEACATCGGRQTVRTHPSGMAEYCHDCGGTGRAR